MGAKICTSGARGEDSRLSKYLDCLVRDPQSSYITSYESQRSIVSVRAHNDPLEY
jgi:hypothetical protein